METTELIKKSLRGDETAFRILVDQYADFAYAAALKILNNEEDAKDVVQDAFLSVWKNLHGFNAGMNFSNWLYKIIINRCFDALRKKKRERIIYPDHDSWELISVAAESDPQKELSDREFGKLVGKMTEKLSAKQKVAFVLCDLEDLPREEASEIAGMNTTSLKSNLNHARRKIEKMMEKFIEHEEGRKIPESAKNN